MLFMLFLGFAALVLRALWIQGPGNAFYEAKAVKGTQRELEMSASRGKILDRNGQVIATSLEAKADDGKRAVNCYRGGKWIKLADLA